MTTPPPCAWCPEPAVEQVLTGTHFAGRIPVREYAWLCPACLAEFRRLEDDKRRERRRA
jgi:hypothetical protein